MTRTAADVTQEGIDALLAALPQAEVEGTHTPAEGNTPEHWTWTATVQTPNPDSGAEQWQGVSRQWVAPEEGAQPTPEQIAAMVGEVAATLTPPPSTP